ncbi:MAG: phosphatase PAP2 family protein [Pseudomonadota bacterium]
MLWPNAGRDTVWMLAGIVVLLVIFRASPGLDMAFSAYFFEPGIGFAMGSNPFWIGVRETFYHLPRALILGSWLWLGWRLYRRPVEPRAMAVPLLAALSAFIGPLLIVNWILKEFWGRPRPYATLQFGGDEFYLPPGTIGDACATNCSFVSGEAAAAFWTLWLVVLVPATWRRRIALALVAVASLVAVLRIAFGRHYISDVTIGGLIGIGSVTLVAWALQTARGRRFVAGLLRQPA